MSFKAAGVDEGGKQIEKSDIFLKIPTQEILNFNVLKPFTFL